MLQGQLHRSGVLPAHRRGFRMAATLARVADGVAAGRAPAPVEEGNAMMRPPPLPPALLPLAVIALGTWASSQDASGQPARPKVGYKDTPMLPGGRWHVHDGDRPLPPVVTPGTCSTQEAPGKAPSDAVVLFDGGDLAHWRS